MVWLQIWATFSQTHLVTLDRCFDSKNIFAKKWGKTGDFDSNNGYQGRKKFITLFWKKKGIFSPKTVIIKLTAD
jgi:hypothetical protein